jgi:hypothetical protein
MVGNVCQLVSSQNNSRSRWHQIRRAQHHHLGVNHRISLEFPAATSARIQTQKFAILRYAFASQLLLLLQQEWQ